MTCSSERGRVLRSSSRQSELRTGRDLRARSHARGAHLYNTNELPTELGRVLDGLRGTPVTS
jgi:hypothetical protein